MPRPNLSNARRRELVPVVARTFAELGYRRATTAELARRTQLRENQLYRLWPDKKAMFIAAIDHVYESSVRIWQQLLEEGAGAEDGVDRLLRYESRHHGELGLYRIVFAGLNETDDPEIAEALRRMYRRFHRFVADRLRERGARQRGSAPEASLAAWAIIGLGTVANITNELGLLSERRRSRLIAEAGSHLAGGGLASSDLAGRADE